MTNFEKNMLDFYVKNKKYFIIVNNILALQIIFCAIAMFYGLLVLGKDSALAIGAGFGTIESMFVGLIYYFGMDWLNNMEQWEND